MSDELKLRNLFEDTLVIWAEVFVLLLLLFSTLWKVSQLRRFSFLLSFAEGYR